MPTLSPLQARVHQGAALDSIMQFDYGTTVFSCGYSNIETLRSDDEFILRRGQRQRDGAIVLLLTTASTRPTAAVLAKLDNEFGLRDHVAPAWVAQPLEMVASEARKCLVLADGGGALLSSLLQQKLALLEVLTLALGITEAVHQLHSQEIVHKDIHPGNILINSASGAAQLTGLGLASRVPRQYASAPALNLICGTFAYMAPEQTGRMNRSVDARSDLYALGVIIYRMLTGVLPFTASNPMAWIHCHIAHRPVAPAVLCPEIPPVLSDIVMKLLEKTAEARYQTAAGLQADLRRCLTQWMSKTDIDAFKLGGEDVSAQLLISERLYGRDEQRETLIHCAERVFASGTPELLLVSGYSGIGKSSLVNELQPVIVRSGAIFISGKFDQYKRNIPYTTVAQAFQALVREVLTRDDTTLAQWRGAIMDSIGPNGQLLVDLIPELKFIIGEQSAIAPLPPTEAQHRFQQVLRQFVNVVATAEHPLVLFLDDLQWADTASLHLLESLLTHPSLHHCLLIGAYRENEVDLAHPLLAALDLMRNSELIVRTISLAPLTPAQVRQLIEDTISTPQVAELAQLVHEKTAGNPFFTIQFLHELAQEGLLSFDAQARRWVWNLGRIRAKAFSDNVVDLMIAKLARLPAPSIAALKVLACLGDATDAAVLATVRVETEASTVDQLWPAVQAGVVALHAGGYRFEHDRIRDAAYSLIDAPALAQLHLKIGRLALERLTTADVEERLFEIVDHLNHGAALVTDPLERLRLCRLNGSAGKRARDAIAYASARHYLSQATTLLPPDAWIGHYAETFTLFLLLSESEFLATNFEASDAVFALLLANAGSDLDRARVSILHTTLYQLSGQFARAVEVSVESFRLLGIDSPVSDAAIAHALEDEQALVPGNMAGRGVCDLLGAPPPPDQLTRMTLELYSVAVPSLYVAHPALGLYFTVKALNLSLVHGNTEASCAAYSGYAKMLVSTGAIPEAYAFSEMALQLNEQCQDVARKGRLLFFHGAFVHFWRHPYRQTIALLEDSFRLCLEVGDLPFAAYSSNHLLTLILQSGAPLAQTAAVAHKYIDFARKSRNAVLTAMHRTKGQVAACMMGLTREEGSLDDASFRTDEVLDSFAQAEFGSGIACVHILKQMSAFTFGRYDIALEAARLAAPQMAYLLATANEHAHDLYYALTLAALHADMAPERQSAALRILRDKLAKLKLWAVHCPENFLSRYALVDAEMARIDGRELDAMRRYDEAIEAARIHGVVQIEGTANELAARFHRQCGRKRIADAYMLEARHCFAQWGALGKVRQIDREWPALQSGAASPGSAPAGTIGLPVEHLDMLSVMRASQAVSGIIVLDTLIKSLLGIVIENVCADRGLLILPSDGVFRIAAEGSTGPHGIDVTLVQAQCANRLPELVLQYVIRTREKVVLANVAAPGQFSGDAYIVDQRPQSIICIPLLKQASLVGILYLENKLTPSVFTANHTAVVEMLASQAAISLENAVLYTNLEKENNDRKRAERALEEYRDQLELTIRERTKELIQQNMKLEEAYRSLEELSYTDQLTGLRNRRFLLQHLEPDISLCLRRHEEARRHAGQAVDRATDLLFFMVDLDHFKAVNDRHGHAAGDSVLVQIRERLQEVFRASDYLIRWGGEEFLVVARSIDRDAAAAIAERLRAAFSDRPFMLDDGTQLWKTCSIGFSFFPFYPEQPHLLSWTQVIELADQGLYVAKHGGRNAWVGYGDGERVAHEKTFERLLHHSEAACAAGELRLIHAEKHTDCRS